MFLSFPLVGTKASERKREESSYQSRVREWKREKKKCERRAWQEGERWRLELENFDGVRLLFVSSSRLLSLSSGTFVQVSSIIISRKLVDNLFAINRVLKFFAVYFLLFTDKSEIFCTKRALSTAMLLAERYFDKAHFAL